MKGRLLHRPLLWLLGALLATAACDQGTREETTTFQEAEALYRAGDYDGATARYEVFLESYPRSPFARTAKMRLRTINREVESVMGTRGSNRPIFIRPTPAETEEILQAVRIEQAASAPTEPAEDEEGAEQAPPASAPAPPVSAGTAPPGGAAP